MPGFRIANRRPAPPQPQTQPDLEAQSDLMAQSDPGTRPEDELHPEDQPHPVDQARPLGRILLFGIQHVLVMAATPISAIFLMAATLGLDSRLTVKLLSAAFVLSGIGSLVQSLGPWKIGPRLPFVMLPGGAPLILFLAIARQHGLRTATGAVILTAAFYFVVLPVFSRLLAFFPSLVIGTMIVIVGVNLVKVGAVLVTGRPGEPASPTPPTSCWAWPPSASPSPSTGCSPASCASSPSCSA
ncbi:solute carrier family 23 protein [Streptomyces cirratus]